jgi:hypothetical protein
METLTLPPPDEIQERITACEIELKSLRRLLRMSRAMRDAEAARQRRRTTHKREGTNAD